MANIKECTTHIVKNEKYPIIRRQGRLDQRSGQVSQKKINMVKSNNERMRDFFLKRRDASKILIDIVFAHL